jgi:hypothetical protein
MGIVVEFDLYKQKTFIWKLIYENWITHILNPNMGTSDKLFFIP